MANHIGRNAGIIFVHSMSACTIMQYLSVHAGGHVRKMAYRIQLGRRIFYSFQWDNYGDELAPSGKFPGTLARSD